MSTIKTRTVKHLDNTTMIQGKGGIAEADKLPQEHTAKFQLEEGGSVSDEGTVVKAKSQWGRLITAGIVVLVILAVVGIIANLVPLFQAVGSGHYSCQTDTDEELHVSYEPVEHEGFEMSSKVIDVEDTDNDIYEIEVSIPGEPEKILKYHLEVTPTTTTTPYLAMWVVNNFTLTEEEESELMEFANVVLEQDTESLKQKKHYALIYTALVYLSLAPDGFVVSNETLAVFQPSAERRRRLQTFGGEGATQLPWLENAQADFTTRAFPAGTSVTALVGDPADDCPGRCGPGCSNSDCLGYKDCFDHDMCLRVAGVTGWGAFSPFNRDCGGEWVDAADDYFASTIANFGNTC